MSTKLFDLRRYVKIVGFMFSISIILLMVLAVALYGRYRTEIPNVLLVEDYRPALKSKAYAQSGELIAEFGVIERIVMKPGTIPPLIAQAFIASEDKNFYRHHGIDLGGIINALLQSLLGDRKVLRGASTITQQLAKSLLIKEEGYEQATARTIARKVKEAILARKLEMHLSKEEILWIYLNDVYLGHGSYGIAAAARTYFHKEPKQLSIGEIAMIAGMPQAPGRFSPQVNLSAAISRQTYVLGRMVDEGFITKAQYDQALDENNDLKVFARENTFRKLAPYFSETIRRKLIDLYGEQRLYEDGLQIFTTLDLDHERAMQNTLKSGLIDIDKRQGFLGPVYSPVDEKSKKSALDMVKKINSENSLFLAPSYWLAQVARVDEIHEALVIDMGIARGLVPLVAMAWARTRDPQLHYASHQLTSVAGVLKVGDVILVSSQTEADLHRQNQEYSHPQKLVNLLHHYSGQQLGLYSLEQEPKIEGAMLAIEPASGYVTAMQGGYSFDRSEFNRVYQACRQPGSLFKPIVYVAALESKKFTTASMILDAPLTFHDGINETTWRPKNITARYKGEVTLHEALIQSMNVPTINIVSAIGIHNVLAWAKKLGVTTKLKAELGTGIGSSCVTPMELAKVFSTFANLGEQVEPTMIKEITDRDHQRMFLHVKKNDPWITRGERVNEIVKSAFTPKTRVIEKEEAYIMHYLLSQTAQFGTAQRTNILHRHLGAKTGTTNDSFDVWFAGYSKDLMSLVWIGNDKMDMPLGIYEQGGRTTLPLFTDFMSQALAGLPDLDWPRPASLCEAHIDARTGLRVTEDHPLSFLSPFRCGTEPPFMDSQPHKSLEEAQETMGNL